MHMKYLIALFLILLAQPHIASAQETAGFGLAMHGNPKYSAQSTHLHYANPYAPKGGTLKQSAVGTFDTLNAYALKGQSPPNMNLITDRLMQRVWDEPFTLYPLIAESADIPEDRSGITFHLNPKARFHDNSPITTADVMFSFETLRDNGRPNMRKIYKLAREATIMDDHTITFKFAEGYNRETVMIFAMMPILSKSWWQGRDFNAGLLEPPLSNGPYRIKSFELGRNIIYERIPDYWAQDLLVNVGHNNFDTITYDYFRDDTIALEAFKKGSLNLRREWDASKWRKQYNDISETIALLEAPHQRPERADGLIFNLRHPPFDDINVRKALSHAFNDEWVKQNLYGNNFKRINSMFPNSILSAKAEQKEEEALSLRQRLKEATTLLTQAGWVIENGQRVNTSTKAPFQFEIIVSNPQDEKIALTFQKSLQRLGITMSIRVLDSATFQNRKLSYDYDMLAFFWQNSLSPGTEQRLYWSCAAAKESARFNFSGICLPEIDALADKIADAPTYDDLIKHTHEMDKILMEQNIYIPLFYKGFDYIAHDKNLHYPTTTPIYGAILETWWENKNL